MTLLTKITIALALGLMPLSSGQAADISDRDFQEFLSWWPGEYDNLAQVKEQEKTKAPAEDRNLATRLFIRRIDVPAFGSNAYYGEWQDANDPSRLLRQRVYAFEFDQEAQRFRLFLHIWPAESPEFVARTRGAHLDPSKLDDVTPDDMLSFLGRECDIFFKQIDGEFFGAMNKGECAFAAPGEPETAIYSWSQMTINDSQYTYLDGWYNQDGSPYRRFTKNWYVYDKKN